MAIYTAVIVEPRIHKAWPIVLSNFLKNLDERWDFLIFCGKNNETYLQSLIDKEFEEHKHRIQIHNTNVDNYSIYQYSELLMSKEFYEKIPTEIFLIFQLDSLISAIYNDYIYDFLQYDYTGAPWYFDKRVGNGGLSLRHKSAMVNIIETCHKISCIEDLFFAHYAENKPSFDDAKKFSVETVFSEKSFGMHKCWNDNHISDEELIKISQHIPDLFTLKQIFSEN